MISPTLPPNLLSMLGGPAGRISRTQVFWILTAGFLLGTLLMGAFFIQAPWQQQRRILEGRYREEVQRSELMMKLGGLTQQINDLEERLLLHGGTPVLTSEVTRLAANFGIQIESVAPKEAVPLDPYRKLQIEMDATASFSNLLLFLHALETHQPFLWVSELQIDRPIPTSAPFRPSTPSGGAAGPRLPFAPEELDPELQRVRITVAALSQVQ